MTDKEKEAIENINKILITEKYTKNIATVVHLSDLETVLNLTQRQQKDIQRMQECLDKSDANNAELRKETKKKDKIIDETYKCLYKILCTCPGSTLKILKNNGFDDYKCSICETKTSNCIDRIKQYFERKVESEDKQ